jgi:hypothetical protein
MVFMAESANLREPIASPAAERPAGGASPGAWAKIKLVVSRSIFWSYERGSWQYDLIVAVILCFIFLTPRAWFQKAPTLGMVDLHHFQGVVEVSHSKAQHTYMVDARLVQSRATQSPEEAARDILEEGLHKQYHVVSIQPVQDSNGVILSYRVMVEE